MLRGLFLRRNAAVKKFFGGVNDCSLFLLTGERLFTCICLNMKNSEGKTVNETLKSAIDWLYKNQYEEGYWNAPLETNCCMEAQWIMASVFCGFENPKNAQIIEYIKNNQREDGSWDVYFNASNGDINTTVECYFALRITGSSPDEPYMVRARGWLLKHEW